MNATRRAPERTWSGRRSTVAYLFVLAALLMSEGKRLYVNREVGVPTRRNAWGEGMNVLQQGVFRRLHVVFRKRRLDIFDISIMNKHQRKYA